MSRLFICGITCGPEIDKIKDLVEGTKDYVDGFIWTVDSMSFGSIELVDFLELNKKQGKIISHPWQNAHDWQANEWLHCGVLKEGDWIWMFDSSESPTEYWLRWIRQGIETNEKNNLVANYVSNRPYLFKYNEYLYFHGTPHWGLYGLSGITAAFKEEDKSQFIFNKRDLNPAKHYQEHDTKYYLYGRSNIIDAFYGKNGQNVVNFHEQKRREFRRYLKEKTGLEPGLKALNELFTLGEDEQFTEYEIEMIELEFCLSEYYRRTILKEDFMKDIVPRREKWSFKNYLKNGDGFSGPNYLGTRLIYDKNIKK